MRPTLVQRTVHEAEQTGAARREGRSPEVVWGSSAVMQRVTRRLRLAARSDCSVLICGETGTGKGVAARALHAASGRADRALVHVDCAALSPSVIESELFGHERGAFTGAVTRRVGRFELAAGGTLLLDEIGELAPPLQAKLLRVLQDREYERLGGTRTLTMTARVVAATNRDLACAISDGHFRSDLYYRLAVVELRIPPLRSRLEDIPALVAAAWRSGDSAPAPPQLDEAAQLVLARHTWPGNVRELFNVLERLALWWPGERVGAQRVLEALDLVGSESDAGMSPNARVEPRGLRLAQVLEECAGNVAEAARRLGLPRSTLRYRLHRERCERGDPADAAEQLMLPGLGG